MTKAQILSMNSYIKNREFKPIKMRTVSALAADLCQWILNTVELAKYNFFKIFI